MEVKIIEERYNPLLGRRELKFQVDHKGRATPVKFEVRKHIAAMLNVDLDLAYIVSYKTKTSTNVAEGICHVYEDRYYVERLVPKHIYRKNNPKETGGSEG